MEAGYGAATNPESVILQPIPKTSAPYRGGGKFQEVWATEKSRIRDKRDISGGVPPTERAADGESAGAVMRLCAL
jgi:hypothetical protein